MPGRVDFKDLVPKLDLDGPVVVASDAHIPMVDEELVEKLIDKARMHAAHSLIFAGDLFNNTMFSRHGPGINTHIETFKGALEIAGAMIREILDSTVIREIHIIPGNHDEWWIKHNSLHMGMRELVTLAYPEGAPFNGPVYVYELPSIQASIDDKSWTFMHPGVYSRISGKVARDMADLYQMNVGVAHGHHLGMVYSTNGKYDAVELGGLFDERYFDYKHQKITSHPAWRSGFVVIEDGDPILYRGRKPV
jgi:hypothetical protein